MYFSQSNNYVVLCSFFPNKLSKN
uniref:Uncharacterized protein n=1 Tax=Arundo donax TaxID=35708 RepID=A0A0A9AL01_ARUDO